MESTSIAGRIQISRTTYERVYDLEYDFEEREGIEVKGKGKMKTYLLNHKHHLPAIEDQMEIFLNKKETMEYDESSNEDL